MLENSLQAQHFTAQGIILFRQVYQENDFILDLLLDNHFRCSALAKNARNSVKRFSGGLEPLQLLSFSLRAPKGHGHEQLFFLEGAQVSEFFDGYKKTWTTLSDGLFLTELLREVLPKGEQEPWVYAYCVGLLRLFSHSEFIEVPSLWKRVFFWSSLSARMGYGVLGERGLLKDKIEGLEELWVAAHASPLEDLAVILKLFNKDLDKSVLKDLYSDWMQRSHLRCKVVETWISS